jgi:hypothetical protein
MHMMIYTAFVLSLTKISILMHFIKLIYSAILSNVIFSNKNIKQSYICMC